jgi:hypothetical protein
MIEVSTIFVGATPSSVATLEIVAKQVSKDIDLEVDCTPDEEVALTLELL